MIILELTYFLKPFTNQTAWNHITLLSVSNSGLWRSCPLLVLFIFFVYKNIFTDTFVDKTIHGFIFCVCFFNFRCLGVLVFVSLHTPLIEVQGVFRNHSVFLTLCPSVRAYSILELCPSITFVAFTGWKIPFKQSCNTAETI